MGRHHPRARALVVASLLLASGFSLALLGARVAYTGGDRFGFLAWNLCLAWIPLLAALAVYDRAKRGRGDPWQVLLGAAWLLFFPNAPYLVTDLIHVQGSWYDAAMIGAFAWTGVLLGLVSLYLMHTVLRRRLGAVGSWAAVAAVLGLGGFGIYLGRFQRWNSWDVLARPRALVADVAAPLADPLAHPRAVAATLVFAGFLALAYLTVYALVELGAGRRSGGTAPPQATSRG